MWLLSSIVGFQTLSHSLAVFVDGGRENPFLASYQEFVPAKTRRQKGANQATALL
jgi:hypothetical protein